MIRALPRLIALSPGDLERASAARLVDALERACAAGLPGFLLREPRLSDREYLELARSLEDLRRRHRGLWFAVHDRAHLARALAADAVHLSFRSLRVEELRPWLGPATALGLSTHAHDDPRAWRGADYVFHGPLRATPDKEHAQAPVGMQGLERAARAAPCPAYALGGVCAEDARELVARGLHGVAVRSRLLGAAEPGVATRTYLEQLEERAE